MVGLQSELRLRVTLLDMKTDLVLSKCGICLSRTVFKRSGSNLNPGGSFHWLLVEDLAMSKDC